MKKVVSTWFYIVVFPAPALVFTFLLLPFLCLAQDVDISEEMEFVEHIVMPEEVMERIKGGRSDFIIIDVRDQDEFSAGHITGAETHPLMSDAFARTAASIPKDRDVFIISEDGKSGFKALRFFMEMGYTRVYNVEGGMENWLYSDLITE